MQRAIKDVKHLQVTNRRLELKNQSLLAWLATLEAQALGTPATEKIIQLSSQHHNEILLGAEARATGAESRADDAEARATDAELRATDAEARAVGTKAEANDAEARATDAEARARGLMDLLAHAHRDAREAEEAHKQQCQAYIDRICHLELELEKQVHLREAVEFENQQLRCENGQLKQLLHQQRQESLACQQVFEQRVEEMRSSINVEFDQNCNLQQQLTQMVWTRQTRALQRSSQKKSRNVR